MTFRLIPTPKRALTGLIAAATLLLLQGCESGSATTVGADNTQPQVTLVIPANASTGVPTGSNVEAIFNEILLASSINTSAFYLADSLGNLVAASISYDSSRSTLSRLPQPRRLLRAQAIQAP